MMIPALLLASAAAFAAPPTPAARASRSSVSASGMPVSPASTKGTLSYVSGDVTVDQAKASAHQAVSEGQVIHTGSGGAAILAFADGSLVKLNPGTTLKLTRSAGATELELESGAVFSQVRKQIAPGRFMIRTRTAVMGVRGTRFFTSVMAADAAQAGDLWMCVNEGAVDVLALKEAKRTLVKAGEGVLLPSGKELTAPKAYAWTKNLNWNMEPEKGDIVDHTRIEYGDLLRQNYD